MSQSCCNVKAAREREATGHCLPESRAEGLARGVATNEAETVCKDPRDD